MTKKEENCRYELLCLLNNKEEKQEKYEKMMKNMKKLLGEENIEKVEEKDWKPVYQISKLVNANYLLICFKSVRGKAKKLEENILQTTPKEFLNRYLLLNLEDESRNKIKLNKKDAEQN